MANFAYIIKDAKGARTEGITKAATMEEAIDKLTKEGATIISVKAASDDKTKKMSLFDKIVLALYKLRTSVGLKVLVFFTRQLSTMFSAGLTLEKAIGNLAKEEKNKRFRKVLLVISEDIKKGYSLSEALEQHPGVFNPLYVSLVKAGEVSGTLHTVLDELSDYLEKMEDTRRKVSSAMAYPVFVLVFLAAVVWGLFYYIIPMFANVYQRMNADLPLPTQIAVHVSGFIRDHIIFTLFTLLVVGACLFIIYLTDRGRYIVDSMMLKVPIIGPMLKNSMMSKFSRTFSILMAAGVPIMDVLDLTQNVVQNMVVGNAIEKARTWVREGSPIAAAFRKTGVFPSTMLQLMATGEETGDMDRLLAKAAEFYEKLVDSVIERLTSLIEPLLIVVMAAVVGTIIVVIYLPIFKLGMAMQKGLK